jgi:OPT family oligopeptide transporter
MISALAYDRYGQPYNITRIITPQVTLDVQAYENYSPPYLPAGFTMTYITGFAIPTCVIVHTALYHSQWFLNTLKSSKKEPDDIHMKLMRQYLEAPDWWYIALLLLFFLLAAILVEIWHTNVPIYLLILSIILPALYIVPSCLILAATGQPAGFNVLVEAIPGAISPGNPFVNILFKTFAVQSLAEAQEFLQDLKLGHYLKIPPRATFIVQLVGTSIAACVQTGVKEWLFTTIHDICTPDQKAHLTCPGNDTFFTASVIW